MLDSSMLGCHVSRFLDVGDSTVSDLYDGVEPPPGTEEMAVELMGLDKEDTGVVKMLRGAMKPGK